MQQLLHDGGPPISALASDTTTSNADTETDADAEAKLEGDSGDSETKADGGSGSGGVEVSTGTGTGTGQTFPSKPPVLSRLNVLSNLQPSAKELLEIAELADYFSTGACVSESTVFVLYCRRTVCRPIPFQGSSALHCTSLHFVCYARDVFPTLVAFANAIEPNRTKHTRTACHRQ